jgi:hypothetical protein
VTPKDFLKNCASAWPNPIFQNQCIGQLSYTTKLRPTDYLRFANLDIEQDLEHQEINALSNAKRAIDCQVDNIIFTFGIKRKRTFPEKLAVVEELGLLAPRILKKVVKIRNLLEHEYYHPQKAEVEDAIDIASLFIEATARPFRSFMFIYFVAEKSSEQKPNLKQMSKKDWKRFGHTFTESLTIEFSEENHCFNIDFVTKNRNVSEFTVDSSTSLYLPLVRYTLEHDINHDTWDEQSSAVALIDLLNVYI